MATVCGGYLALLDAGKFLSLSLEALHALPILSSVQRQLACVDLDKIGVPGPVQTSLEALSVYVCLSIMD